jgi:acyl-CoA synthetase (AMP-forming)/AMP-acid ligase II
MHQLLYEAAMRRPDALALNWIDRDRTLTYERAAAATDDMAGALASLGIGKGDRVTIFAHNGLDYLVAMLGIWRVGAIAALVNVKFADELDYYLGDHQPSAIIYTHDMQAPVKAAARNIPSVRHLICMDGAQDGALSLPDLMAAHLRPPSDPADPGAIAHLSYTSGTTGKPKGACLSHEPTVTAARCIGERLRLHPDDISFGPTALSSSYQLVANILPPLAKGAMVAVLKNWTPAAGWEALERTRATAFVANPTLLGDLLAECRRRARTPSRLRYGLSGGGPVPPSLKRAFRDELRLPLVESFGQSELGGFMALGFPDLEPDDSKLIPVGPPLPDKEIRIAGADDEPLPTGKVGPILLRGGFMNGYWGKPDKTRETTHGGWLRTGDLGLMDGNGNITMRGRRSELIRVAGVDWFPRDVEEALTDNKAIRFAAVVGVPDDKLGMRPHAVVTLAAGASVDLDEIRTEIAGKVAYDLEHLVIGIRDELPMTPTGKIAKAELAASLTEEAQ